MNKRNKNLYDKAMGYYEQGKINKALEACEVILAENLETPVVLNFKGLLLYQKGDLKGAVSMWQLNLNVNNDKFAGKYIEDSRNDSRRLELYKEGEGYLKQLKIDSALEKLKQCAESDFNTIKVNTALAIAYQKKGEFILAKQHVENALKIDCDYASAKKVKSELIDIGMYKGEERNHKSTKAISFLTGIVVLIVVCMGSYMAFWKINDSRQAEELRIKRETEAQNKAEQWKEIEEKNQLEKQESSDDESQDNTEPEDDGTKNEVKKTTLDSEKINTLISNDDFDDLYNELSDVDLNMLKNNDKELYDKAAELLKSKGVEKFYEDGVENFNSEKYEDALSDFNKAYDYCESSYLDEHVIFYKARTFLEQGNKKEAIKSYKEYYSKYPENTYTSGVLYQLALLTYENDITESKNYANELIGKYPKSIYINERINSILNS